LVSEDFLDQMIAKRTARDPDFPQKLEAARRKRDTSYHERRLAKLLADPELAADYRRQLRYLGQSGRTPSE
jgi:hypothetical protein